MSFTSDVRDELARVELADVHCRRAELAAIVRIGGSMMVSSARYRLEIATDNAPVARRIISLIHSTYGLKTESIVRRSILHNTNNYLITIPTQQKLGAAIDDMGLAGEYYHAGIAPHLIEKDCCAVSYLRGAFLAGGFISNPVKDMHFEISVHSEEIANDIKTLMNRFDINPKISFRRSKWNVYLKSAEPAVEMMARMGAIKSLLHVENIRVVKERRLTVNRRVNAEMANQAKATYASIDQHRAIKVIEQNGGIDSLPPALREFVVLRMDHPELSLRELGEVANPVLSKSAVNHRMRRIEAIARDLVE